MFSWLKKNTLNYSVFFVSLIAVLSVKPACWSLGYQPEPPKELFKK
ncbi:cyclic lactone autoinducer peptide [Heliobacterium undosum]|uniref:Cyclic lactone autoinducer peptide n=1 Tax=Heliomicrobium undosum TaxID=121734 RepID=A0A845LEX7_9FIRM|nr:cyclic lactone autoinducer peptide [Heliomicrobium undosum]